MRSQQGGRLRCATPVLVLAVIAPISRAAEIASTYNGASGGSYETAANWSPNGVPNNSGSNIYDVTLPGNNDLVSLTGSNSVSVNSLTFGADPVTGYFDDMLEVTGGASFSAGTTTMSGTYGGSDAGVLAYSTTAGSASVSLGTFTNFDSTTGTLSNAVLSALVYQAGTSQISFANANVVTINHSYVALGAGGEITDGIGQNAFRNLAALTNGTLFDIIYENFTTAGDFSVSSDSQLYIQNGIFKISGNFDNYNTTTSTLTGGDYYLAGQSGYTAVLQFNGDIVTNNANIELANAYYAVLDGSSLNALRTFTVNQGSFSVSDGAQFTTSGNLTNTGTLAVSTQDDGKSSTLAVAAGFSLTNYNAATGELSGGYYEINGDSGADSATLKFANTGIVTNSAYITLYGANAQITDLSGNNALRTLTTNSAAGSLFLADTSLSTPGLSNAGVLYLQGAATLNTSGTLSNSNSLQIDSSQTNSPSFVQTAGNTDLEQGTLSATTIAIQGGTVTGGGTMTGAVTVAGGTLSPGATNEDTDILDVTGSLDLSGGGAHSAFYIAGTTRGAGGNFDPVTFAETGGYDAIDVTGSLKLGGELDLTLYGGFTPSAGDQYTLMTSTALTGSFSNVADGATLMTTDGAGEFTVYYGLDSPFGANDVVLANFTAVPEPAVVMTSAVTIGLLLMRRRVGKAFTAA